MSKNRGDYVAAQERVFRNTSVRASCDVTALAHQPEIDPAREDTTADQHWYEVEREFEAIDRKSTIG
jgi:hypothetical protein